MDDTIDLSEICETDWPAPPPPGKTLPWVMEYVVEALVGLGIDPPDIDAFTHHVFAVHANGPGFDPARKLTEEQWDRLKFE